MFDNFSGSCEKVFWKSTLDCVGQVRSSLGEIMEKFAVERLAKGKDMYWNFRAMNGVKSRSVNPADKALSSQD